MSDCCCSNGATPAGRLSRVMTAGPASGLMCGVLWLLCPKCPACVAAYLAMFGGLTISVPAIGLLLAGVRGALIAAMPVGAIVLAWRLRRNLVR